MTTGAFTRGVTVVAVGFLLLNAVLLAMIGHWVWAGTCLRVAVLVVLGWFWYRRELAELREARKDMKREVESLRALLDTHRRN